MNIGKIHPQDGRPGKSPEVESGKSARADREVRPHGARAEPGTLHAFSDQDSIALSRESLARYGEMQGLVDRLADTERNEPQIDSEKLREVRGRLESGYYSAEHVLEDTARRMMQGGMAADLTGFLPKG